MNPSRSLGAVVLAAMLAGSVLAQAPAARDDEAIFADVEEALQAAPALAAARITILIRDGYVTLSGHADTMKDVATAGRLAARVSGVTGVSNRIRVVDRPMRT
jgi:osmotically-inducible protein OsmY